MANRLILRKGSKMLNKNLTKMIWRKGDEGFTLVEVMIGMAIFFIGFLAVGTMQLSAVKGNTTAREATEAATRATSRLETLIALPYDSIEGPDSVTDGAYKVSWNVAEEYPLPNTKTITVTVDWHDRGPRSFEVTYTKTRNL
jgi:prepilin-type N-terminal cleavage/methylation domain-containing protein